MSNLTDYYLQSTDDTMEKLAEGMFHIGVDLAFAEPEYDGIVKLSGASLSYPPGFAEYAYTISDDYPLLSFDTVEKLAMMHLGYEKISDSVPAGVEKIAAAVIADHGVSPELAYSIAWAQVKQAAPKPASPSKSDTTKAVKSVKPMPKSKAMKAPKYQEPTKMASDDKKSAPNSERRRAAAPVRTTSSDSILQDTVDYWKDQAGVGFADVPEHALEASKEVLDYWKGQYDQDFKNTASDTRAGMAFLGQLGGEAWDEGVGIARKGYLGAREVLKGLVGKGQGSVRQLAKDLEERGK
jgi:hypothetical protein